MTQEGWSVTHRYQDKAISGNTNVRPGYQQLLADAETKCFDIVLVDDFSRLSRDQVESEQVRRRMVHWGCRLIGVTSANCLTRSRRNHPRLTARSNPQTEGDAIE